MKVNLPAPVRIALYVLTLIGAPVVVYLRAKDIIGDLELVLWGAEVSAVSALAAFNVPIVPASTAKRWTRRKGEDGALAFDLSLIVGFLGGLFLGFLLWHR